MTEDRRSALIDRLADFLLQEGIHAASLRPMAKAAGLSDRMLLYYFKDKGEVLTAALTRIAERVTLLLDAGAPERPLPLDALRQHLWTALSDDQYWPYMQVWLDMASLSARGDPVCRAVGEQIGRGFVAWGETHLESHTPTKDAARLLTSIEGMVLLKSLGLQDVSDRAV